MTVTDRKWVKEGGLGGIVPRSHKTTKNQNSLLTFLQIIKRYVPKTKASIHSYVFFKLMYRNWKEISLMYGGLDAKAPRSQRYFKESDKREA